MGQILVRKIDDEALERLRVLADEQRLPLEALARKAIEAAARQKTQKELRQALSELENLRAHLPKGGPDSTRILRALRDGDGSSHD